MKTFKNKLTIGLISGLLLITFSCSDYLDVIPDDIPTIDHAFNKRHQAEGFLYGCYSFLPEFAYPAENPGIIGGDEVWLFESVEKINLFAWYIASGRQGTNTPYLNYWSSIKDGGTLGGRPLFTAISDCNIFIENIHKPADLEEWERTQWIAEAKALKAFFHFWLLRMYGPIPILDKNIPISASPSEVQVYREPVDKVVEYIVDLLDEAYEDLPLEIENISLDLGRFTQPIVKALKAQVLTLSASPLFNGNPDYLGFKDNRGISLFPEQYDATKWERAAEALEEAIDIAHQAGHTLFDFSTTNISVSNETALSMQVRGAVTERWNDEIIWGSLTNTDVLTRMSLPAMNDNHKTGRLWFLNAPTLRVVKQFYTKNGVPIEEDKDWQNVDLFGLRTGDEENEKLIGKGYTTINLHYDREPRFYGSISFDGGKYYGYGVTSDNDMRTISLRYGLDGRFRINEHSSTGYLVKKVVHRLTAITEGSSSVSLYRYAFPIIRLADLYLMYAEALNEAKDVPDNEVYQYIDLVRYRTGLDGVVDSWSNHSLEPNKPSTKEGMRDIIQRERLNELAFEGIRFWDLRRWKLAEKYMNEPIQGFDILESDPQGFYQVQDIYFPYFTMKDYLWPIKQSNLLKNRNLVQNPGW